MFESWRLCAAALAIRVQVLTARAILVVSGVPGLAVFAAARAPSCLRLIRSGMRRASATPGELRTSFVRLMSHCEISIEEITRLVGHSSTRTTEVAYRRELRPMITRGAEIMDEIFRTS